MIAKWVFNGGSQKQLASVPTWFNVVKTIINHPSHHHKYEPSKMGWFVALSHHHYFFWDDLRYPVIRLPRCYWSPHSGAPSTCTGNWPLRIRAMASFPCRMSKPLVAVYTHYIYTHIINPCFWIIWIQGWHYWDREVATGLPGKDFLA